MPLFGLETEYGIAVDGKGASDMVAEARAVVRSYGGRYASPWYYRGEDPRNDMRGFHVDRLAQDPDDAQFDDPRQKPLPIEEERSDRILANGARLYNDHGHPEYATPECASLRDLVAHDKAGERIVWECARARVEDGGAGRIQIFKNNTDFHGSSYGTHENYLLRRDLPFPEMLEALLPFFATRIIYAGAGKIGIEPRGSSGVYQLSQRADFFTEEASVDTLHRRPLVNTRDEPHADPRQWRRLHVICGDANMSEYASALKVGATYLVLSLLELGWRPKISLRNPVQAIKEISRDASLRWISETESRGTIGAVDLQRVYLTAAKEQLAGRGSDTDWVLAEWESTLDGLERDPLAMTRRLDWAAKRALLAEYVESEGVRWDDEALPSFDLAYSSIDPDEGLYYALEQAGDMVRVVTDEDIDSAIGQAPQNTRASIRGELVARFTENVGAAGWNRVIMRAGSESWMANLDDYLTPDAVRPALARVRAATSLEQLLSAFPEGAK